MIYKNVESDMLTVLTYGSHLYGTNSETSDFDFKSVYLPDLTSLVLCKPANVKRHRFDEDGKPVSDSASMPANGYEIEIVPVQKMFKDFFGGQAYAIEMAFAVQQGAFDKHITADGGTRWLAFKDFCSSLTSKYLHKNVNGMVGFALKQTFDYVRRGERLVMAKNVLNAITLVRAHFSAAKRLDSCVADGDDRTVLDVLVEETGLEPGVAMSNNKQIKTLILNGRSYLETTALDHLETAVRTLVSQYGERSTRASETDVDWKSLSHAVRVYEQVIELLRTKTIVFPRKNAAELLAIKSGKVPLEDVKALLIKLDDQTQEELAKSDLPDSDAQFKKAEDELLLPFLKHLYHLKD